jgi:hypothetical protein
MFLQSGDAYDRAAADRTESRPPAFSPRKMSTPPTAASPQGGLQRFVPRSSRLRATLLAAAALLAFLLALLVGKASADSSSPLHTARPLVPSSQAVQIRGLPAARTLPVLRPRVETASAGKGPKPVLVVGEG